MGPRRLLALALGAGSAAALVACSLLVDVSGLAGGGGGTDAALDVTGPRDGGVDGSALDAFVPDAFVPDAIAAYDGAPTGDLRFFAGTGSAGGIHASTWVHAQGAWASPGLITLSSNSTVAWIVPALLQDGNELLAIESQFATATGLDVVGGAGSSFTKELTVPGLRQAASADRRSFDLALEGLTGDAMLVYSDDSPNPKWRRRVAGNWTSEAPVFTTGTGPGTGAVEWIELAPRSSADTIALVYSSNAAELFAVIWDGSTWGAPTQLAPQSFASYDDGGTFGLYSASWQCFGAAYTDPGGDLFVGYSLAMYGYNSGFVWSVVPSGQTAFSTPTPVANFVPPGPLSLASEPGTNHIAVAYLEQDGTCTCDDFDALVWDGTQIANFTLLDDNYGLRAYGSGASPVAAGWYGSGSRAVAVYAHANPDGGVISGNLGWGKWSASNGWVLQPEAPMIPPLAQLASARLAPLATGDLLFGFLQDVSGAIWTKSFDGNSWNDAYDGGPIEPNVSRTTGVPFAALPR